MTPALTTAKPIVYPEDDGNPMAEQARLIEKLQTQLKAARINPET
jgi:hypothetical protein